MIQYDVDDGRRVPSLIIASDISIDRRECTLMLSLLYLVVGERRQSRYLMISLMVGESRHSLYLMISRMVGESRHS